MLSPEVDYSVRNVKKPAAVRKDRNPALDVLRALAILMVLFAHLDFPPDTPADVKSFLEFFSHFGWAGVDLFFVLSGYLISNLLFREWQRTGTISYSRFFIRRGYKIYPAFYLLLIFTIAHAIPFREEMGISWFLHLLSEMFFLQNYWLKFWPHTWSLAVEEHFYLALPLVLLAMGYASRKTGRLRKAPNADPFRSLLWLFVIVALACLAGRWAVVANGVRWFGYSHFPTHLRIDSLLFGVLISYGFNFHGTRIRKFVGKNSPLCLLVALICLSPIPFLSVSDRFLESAGLTLTYLGFGSLLVWALLLPDDAIPRRNWLIRFLVLTGQASYCIYLWHVPFRVLVRQGHDLIFGSAAPAWLGLIEFYFGSIFFGALLTKLIEEPLLRYRDRAHPPA